MKRTTLVATLTGGGAGSAGLAALAHAPTPVAVTLAAIPLLGMGVKELCDIVKREQFARKSGAVRRDMLEYVELEQGTAASRPRARGARGTGT